MILTSFISQETTYNPSWVKSRYGAWYLDPKTWKELKANEPLKDPALENNENGIHSKTKLSQKVNKKNYTHVTLDQNRPEMRKCNFANINVFKV